MKGIESLKIGDTIYRFDVNRRRYGPAGGQPIFREHFVPHKIIGQNRVSWLLDQGWRCNKKTLACAAAYHFGGGGFFTAGRMEDSIWAAEHRLKIVHLIQGAEVSVLRDVARIIGYGA